MARQGKHLAPRRPRSGAWRNPALASVAIVVVAFVPVVGEVTFLGSADGQQAAADSRSIVRTSGSQTDDPVTAGRSSAAPVVAPAVSGPRGRRGSGEGVTLAFGGDVHFEGRIRQRLEANPATVMAGVAPLLESADIAIVNLETAVTTRGTKAPDKQFAFRAPPSAFAALRAGGVDVASMANNHGMDYGREGLEDSLAAAGSAGIPVIGIGRSAAEAYRPHIREVRGQRIAVIGATQVLDDALIAAWTATDVQPGLASAKEVGRLTAAVREARAQSDTVVVVVHWGTEGQTCPNAAQPLLAQALAEAGADVIVGGHAHRLQGAGRLGSAFVAYGLGNFVFYSDSGPGTDTGVLTLTVTGRDVDEYRWTPARLQSQLPRALVGPAAAQALEAWEALRACTGLTK